MTGGMWLAALVATAPAGPAAAVSIDIGGAAGRAGEAVPVAVTLASEGAEVVATQNRIDFSRQAFVAARVDGEPDCAVNPAIDKGATGFRFLPLGCDPAADCASLRVFVLAFDNLDAIADGATLYTCTVRIADGAAPGVYPLANAEQGASAIGGLLLPSDGADGAVEVLAQPPAARLRAGAVEGEAGEVVALPLAIELLDDVAVAGVQVDLTFQPETPIAATESGKPACAVEASIGKEATSFAFLPMGCTAGSDCSGVRAFVLSLSNADALPDGATLFTCDVAIAATAPPGVYPVATAQALASGPAGELLPALTADGSVTVVETPPPACAGDCNGDGAVSINELLLGVNIASGTAPPDQCPALAPGGEAPTISNLIQAVNAALAGCPA